MIPKKLQKPTMQHIDINRITRVIRIQGIMNILFVLALAGSWLWFYKIDPIVNAHALAYDFDPPVRVDMKLQAHNGVRYVAGTDILRTPIVSIYGKIKNYDALIEALDGFGVRVHGIYVQPKLGTGEFVEKILLNEGKNAIPVTIEWDQKVQYKYDYSMTYIKPEGTVHRDANLHAEESL